MRNFIGILLACFLLFQAVGCASAKKPLTSSGVSHTNAKKESPVKAEPSTRALPAAKKNVLRRRQDTLILNDSVDRLYPLVLKPVYKIALLLPLYLYKTDLSKAEKNAASISQDFYRGFLMGTDTLKHCGINLNIYVLEVDRSKAGRERLKDTLKSLDIDLVIGPLMESEVKKFAPFCSANKINLATPVATLDSCFDKTYYLESNPGPGTYGRNIANLVKKDFADRRSFLVNERTSNDNPIAKEIVAGNIGDSFHVVDYKGKGAITTGALKNLSDKNLVIIPSKNEIFVSSVLAQLQLDTMDREITIVGMYPWLYFKSLEGSVWERFNLHLACPFYVDYSKPEIKTFVGNFRLRYNDEPNEYSFRGFDEIVYYGKMLQKFGKFFQRGFGPARDEGLHTSYHFENYGNCAGYRNTGLHILKFEDYRFIKVDQ
jgi:hypothetical protein